ncbi:MAG: MFS transporter [Gammaproteobacteria bacterium]|nr:MFS transporter [Gammaproteobacteria bacterium]|tara:strand:- start:2603 stop:3823 length:1221 start_codon:yes stop_codon:yes gene_type:complete
MNKNQVAYMPIIISGCALVLLSFGYRAGFGLFLQPMSEAREWGRDVLALALAVQNLAWGVFAIIAGGLVDKYGNLKVLSAGVFFYAVGMYAMAYSTSELAIISTAGLLVGAGVAGTSFGIVLPAFARAVPEEKQGWALGIGTAAGSIGQFLVVPFMQFAVDLFGWFQALQYIGLSAFLMTLFILPLAKYGGPSEQEKEFKTSIPLLSVVKNAFKVRAYVLLVFGFYVCGFHLAFITVHMPSYLIDLGFSANIGAWSISLIGLCNVFGAYYAGVISANKSKRKMLAAIYAGRAGAIALFLSFPISVVSVLIFSAAMGFLWLATVPPTSALVAQFFGVRYMTLLYGIVFFSHQVGSFTGIWLGGRLYEDSGSYDGVWIAGIILGLIAAGLHWVITEKDYSDRLQPAYS